VGDISDEEMFEDGLEVVANSAVVRAGYRKLMDEIVGKDEELSSIESHQLLGYMQLLDNKPGGSSPGGRNGCHVHQAPVHAVGGADERQQCLVQARGKRGEVGGQHEGGGRAAPPQQEEVGHARIAGKGVLRGPPF